MWTYLTTDEVSELTKFLPFFSLEIFKAEDLRALMLVRPVAAVNNGNPAEDGMEPKQRDADYYAMQSARFTNKLDIMQSPHATMLAYTRADRHIWVEKIFGFEGYIRIGGGAHQLYPAPAHQHHHSRRSGSG